MEQEFAKYHRTISLYFKEKIKPIRFWWYFFCDTIWYFLWQMMYFQIFSNWSTQGSSLDPPYVTNIAPRIWRRRSTLFSLLLFVLWSIIDHFLNFNSFFCYLVTIRCEKLITLVRFANLMFLKTFHACLLDMKKKSWIIKW